MFALGITIPFVYLLISWVTNYAYNSGFLNCLSYKEISRQTLPWQFCKFTSDVKLSSRLYFSAGSLFLDPNNSKQKSFPIHHSNTVQYRSKVTTRSQDKNLVLQYKTLVSRDETLVSRDESLALRELKKTESATA